MSEPKIDEGRSSTRPVLFNGEDYDYWKSSMCSYLSDINIGVWEITTEEGWVRPSRIVDGVTVYTPRENWSPAEKDRFAWNNKAVNVLHSALTKSMFRRISHCKTSKDIWDCLRVTYEGTAIVRNAKLQDLTTKFELCRMTEDEKFDDYHGRMIEIVGARRNLGDSVSDTQIIKKMLRSLPKRFSPKVVSIEDTKDLDTVRLDEFIGSMITFELNHLQDEEPAKKASNAFKSSFLENFENFNEDDVAMIVKRLYKSFKRGGYNGGESSGNARPYKEQGLLPYKPFNDNKQTRAQNEKEIIPRGIQCFECKGYGHRAADCANNKYKGNNNKNFMGTWDDDSDDEPGSSDGNDNNVNFTAFATSVNFDDVHFDDSHLPDPLNENIGDVETANDFSREEMFEDIKSLRELSKKLLDQNTSLKDIVKHLESENVKLNEQVSSLSKDLKNTDEILSKFNKSSHDLDKAISLGKSPMDKSGLGSHFISGNDNGSTSKSNCDNLKEPLNKPSLENRFVLINDKVVPITSESTSDSKFRPSSSKGVLPIPTGNSLNKSAFRPFPASKTIPNDFTSGRKVPLGLPRNNKPFKCSYCKKFGHTIDFCFALKETNLANELRKVRDLRNRNRSAGFNKGQARRKSPTRTEWRPREKKKDNFPKPQIHPRQGTRESHKPEGIWFRTREDMEYYLDEYLERKERARGARFY